MAIVVNQKEYVQKDAIEALRVQQYKEALEGGKPELMKANRSSEHSIPKNGQHLVWVVSEYDEHSANRREIKKREVLTSMTKDVFAQFVDKSGDFKNSVFVNAQKTTIIHLPEQDAIDPIHAILNNNIVVEGESYIELENKELKKQIEALKKGAVKRGRKLVINKDDVDNDLGTK